MDNNLLTLLQYDSNPEALISRKHDGEFNLSSRLLYLFADDEHFNKFVTKYNGKVVAHFNTITKVSYVFEINYCNYKIVVAQGPLGAPAATMFMDMLISNGVDKVIAIGSCGSLIKIDEDTLLMPTAACVMRELHFIICQRLIGHI